MAFTMAALLFATLATAAKRTAQPNIVMILTDDQDLHLGSLNTMTNVQEQLIAQGTQFSKHYGHVSLCCPARATIWTGKHAHNTNITSVVNQVAGGAWTHIQQFGWYKKLFPSYMQAAGYNTYYAGKIFNGFGTTTYCTPVCVEGWSQGDFLVDPRTYTYYNSTYVHYDGTTWGKPVKSNGYSTDQISDYVTGFIDEAATSGKPFFAVAAPIAPHNSIGATYPGNRTRYPFPVPNTNYSTLYSDLQLPQSPNFNPNNRTGVAGTWSLEQLNQSNLDYLEQYYQHRQGALQSVDDLVGAVISKLDSAGVLDNTYIIYTTDNGYHIGNHRLQPGKQQCWEEDVNLPFIIRGPDVGKNQTWDLVTGHVDLAPTLLTLAGVPLQSAWELDGVALSFPIQTPADYTRNLQTRGHELSHIEFWGPFFQEGLYKNIGVDPNLNLQIYKALRVQGNGYNLMYSVWCQDGAHELYDMSWDPYQMTNLHPDAPAEPGQSNAYAKGMTTLLGRPIWEVIYRLDALVLVEKTCVADSCREPWQQLHPTDNATTLLDALNPRYDKFYQNSYEIAKVGWAQCYTGYSSKSSSTLYSLDNEQPVWLNSTIVQLVQKGESGRMEAGRGWMWVTVLLSVVKLLWL